MSNSPMMPGSPVPPTPPSHIPPTSGPPMPPAGARGPGFGPGFYPQQQRPRRRWVTVLLLLMLAGSVLLNLMLFAAVSVTTSGGGGTLQESVISPGQSSQTIAVLNIEGMIDGKTAALVHNFVQTVKGDADVKAVVLRVVTGGGGVADCDRIYNELNDLKQHKKMVVSMGSVAASGGYYISAAADAIFAEPSTVTGSIGVIAMWPIMKDTLDKIGVQMMIVRSTHAKAWKAYENPFEIPAKYQVEDLQAMIDAMQTRFEDIVKTGRASHGLTPRKVTRTYDVGGAECISEEIEPFNGRVFLADEAKKIGLIDTVGYLDDAVNEAARLAGLSRPRVVQYQQHRGLLGELGLAQERTELSLKVLDELQTPRMMMVWKVTP